jgi:hypothetical protein
LLEYLAPSVSTFLLVRLEITQHIPVEREVFYKISKKGKVIKFCQGVSGSLQDFEKLVSVQDRSEKNLMNQPLVHCPKYSQLFPTRATSQTDVVGKWSPGDLFQFLVESLEHRC